MIYFGMCDTYFDITAGLTEAQGTPPNLPTLDVSFFAFSLPTLLERLLSYHDSVQDVEVWPISELKPGGASEIDEGPLPSPTR